MAEENYQSLPLNTSQPMFKREHTPLSGPSSASEEMSISSNPTRTKRSSISPNTAASSGQPKGSTRQRQKAKSIPIRGQAESSRNSIMAMPGLLDQEGEITYTPTTHRISKAKKGKKVHACEYPGCSKVSWESK